MIDMWRQDFDDALAAHGLALEAVVHGDWSAKSGYDAVRALQPGLSSTAIVAANDQMAIGAILALSELGLRVPEDVSVTGMDDTTINALARRLCAGTVVVSLDRSCLVSHGADRHGDAADLYRVPTCGSGDVFKGTLAARLLDARCFRDALLAACDAAR